MSIKFKKGDSVRQIVKPIEGGVTGQEIIDDSVHYKVEFTGADGERHERFFTEEQIEAAE